MTVLYCFIGNILFTIWSVDTYLIVFIEPIFILFMIETKYKYHDFNFLYAGACKLGKKKPSY